MSRSNEDGTSKANTAPKLAETITTDRNSKEYPQNKVNLKELPQLKKCFSFFITVETKLIKCTWKQKHKECKGRSHLIYSQAVPLSQLCMFILCVM